MDELGMMLDVSHLADESFHEVVNRFQGSVLNSNSNSTALVLGDRQLDDTMIQHMIERDGVIEAVMDAWLLQRMTWRSDDLALLTCEAA
jgi:membrane dipeptidase